MFNIIKSIEDIEVFLDKTNALHDGYIISVQYTNNGITRLEHGLFLNPEPTKLILQILVTSINDTIVEIEFENLLEWQIKDNQCDITDTTVTLNEKKWILWSDDIYTNMADFKEGSYAVAKSMKWRIVK